MLARGLEGLKQVASRVQQKCIAESLPQQYPIPLDCQRVESANLRMPDRSDLIAGSGVVKEH
jgi:hypothetical protein